MALLSLVVAACSTSTGQTKATPEPAATAAAPAPQAAGAAPKSLYDRLGGKPAIVAVVDEFVARVAADKRINQRFGNTDIPRLKVQLVEFVCAATGGPCKYTGRDMHTAHASMDLVEDEFTALVQDLQGALVKLNVPAAEQNELLGALGPLKEQIIHPPPPEAAKHDPALAKQALERAEKLRQAGKAQAADLLEVAVAARTRGQRPYAEHLFSSAELLLEPDALAAIAPLFREGAPRRVTTPLKTMPTDSQPQPTTAVGNSDEDQPEAKPKPASLEGKITVDGKPLSDGMAVITLSPVAGKWAKRIAKLRVIEQRDRQFAPHVLAVPVGSTVAFPNFDPIFHNVFSRSQTNPFDLGIYKSGQSRDVKFEKEGIVRVGCDLHANMLAYVVVVAAPHYAVTGRSGVFNFRSLRPGKYKVQVWSDRSASPKTQEITIKPATNSLTMDIHGDAAADLGTDKFGVPRGKAH